jgi:hypothetical protein
VHLTNQTMLRHLDSLAERDIKEPVIASVIVTPKGGVPSATRILVSTGIGQALGAILPVGGAVGGAITGGAQGLAEGTYDTMREKRAGNQPKIQLPPSMYMAASSTKLALYEMNYTIFSKASLGNQVLLCPRYRIQNLSVEKGRHWRMRAVRIRFTDGFLLELEVDRVYRKFAEKIESEMLRT